MSSIMKYIGNHCLQLKTIMTWYLRPDQRKRRNMKLTFPNSAIPKAFLVCKKLEINNKLNL